MTMLLHWLVVVFIAIQGAQGQCPGTTTFEKITGYVLENSSRSPLFSSPGNTVTAECNNRCREAANCQGFIIDYDNATCYRLESNTDDFRTDLAKASTKVNFFEKICLTAPTCEKAWLFDRVPGFELSGYDDLVASNVASRRACEELCLESVDLPCRSAEYDYKNFVCKLSTETRRTQPTAYRASIADVDYLENQCVEDKQGPKQCDYVEYENQDLGFADLQFKAEDRDECQRRCEGLVAFRCRSFTFDEDDGSCRLSGDDNISAGPDAIQVKPGSKYYQRAPCVDLSLVCTATSMTVTLNTEEAFQGKIFAFSNPKQCVSRGEGKSQTTLSFEYEDPQGRCGVQLEEKGVFSNTIVIQHHPVIQQKGDRAIKLFCFFEVTSDKVVTNSYDVIAETIEPKDPSTSPNVPGIPTSVVNGTAPQPQVLLRITNEAGEDIDGTRLGEPLFLRIELDGDSIFDIFARNLVAQSGVDEEEIKLLDDRGCPTDPVFPGLAKEEGSGALIGRFEAFKFSDSSIVNFQVNVQFCQGSCNPVDCGDGVLSFGRRRRRRRQALEEELPKELAARLVYDPDLDQQVIYHDTPLQKLIYVEPGTKVDEFKDPVRRGNVGGVGGVFVSGDFAEDDVFCASWTVVIVTAASFVFLQFCILVVCVLCIYASRRSSKHDQHDTYSASTTDASSSVASGSHLRSHDFHHHRTSEHSGHTLRSLRTSLRD